MKPWNGPEGDALASSVLLVDDEKVVREVFGRLLGAEPDLALTTAATAEEALELLGERRFDLLVTDKNLPGLGGIELIARARALRPQLEAIMITGYGSAESVLAAIAAGASDYLLKPFPDLRIVRAKLRTALTRREDRLRLRRAATENALMATALLARGRDASDEGWSTLDRALRAYEELELGAHDGRVRVCGPEELVGLLTSAGLRAELAPPDPQALSRAAVAVIDAGLTSWRALALKARDGGADVILVANPATELLDLLDANSAGIALVGFGGPFPPRSLPEKVRTALQRRKLEQAQVDLARAVVQFRSQLDAVA